MLWTTILKQLAVAAIPLIIDAGKKIIGNIGNAPPTNDKSRPNDIEQISVALSELRDHVTKVSEPEIKRATDAVMYYIEEQMFNLEDKAELFEKYQISSRSVENKLNRIGKNMENFWRDALYKRISLDNAECRNILLLPAGAKKEHDIERLTQSILAQTTEEYGKIIRDELNGLYDELESNIEKVVANIEKVADNYAELANSFDEKDDEKYEEIIAKAQTKIACYDVVLDWKG